MYRKTNYIKLSMQMKNKVGAIIQARMSSKRLPGKVFKLINGKPIIEHLMIKLKKSKLIKDSIIATTSEKEDQKIINWCKNKEYKFFAGEKNDVLSRFYYCAKENQIDTIVRITSDNPLIDIQLVDNIIKIFKEQKIDYIANNLIKTYPHGLDVEVFNFKSLKKSFFESSKTFEREHVTQYIRHNDKKFTILNHAYFQNHSDIRITIDTKEDLKLVRKIVKILGIYPSHQTIIKLFKNEKSLKDINKLSSKSHMVYNKRQNII